jgi:hypothetical protein
LRRASVSWLGAAAASWNWVVVRNVARDTVMLSYLLTYLLARLASQMTKEEEALALPGLDDKPDARSMRTRLANLD